MSAKKGYPVINRGLLYRKYAMGRKVRAFIKSVRVVTKISSCRRNTTSRRGIKQLWVSFDSIFLLFSNESSWGPHS